MTTEAQPLHIRLPVDARFAQTLRLAASSIASTADFTVDQIEDLKIAVEEAYLMSVEASDGPKELDFAFSLFEDRLEIRVGTLPAVATQSEAGEEKQTYGLMILSAVVDEAKFVTRAGGTELVMIKLKEREA